MDRRGPRLRYILAAMLLLWCAGTYYGCAAHLPTDESQDSYTAEGAAQ